MFYWINDLRWDIIRCGGDCFIFGIFYCLKIHLKEKTNFQSDEFSNTNTSDTSVVMVLIFPMMLELMQLQVLS